MSGKEGAELRSEHQAEARGSCRAGGRSSVAGRGAGRGRGPPERRLLLCGHGMLVWFSREKKGWLRNEMWLPGNAFCEEMVRSLRKKVEAQSEEECVLLEASKGKGPQSTATR